MYLLLFRVLVRHHQNCIFHLSRTPFPSSSLSNSLTTVGIIPSATAPRVVTRFWIWPGQHVRLHTLFSTYTARRGHRFGRLADTRGRDERAETGNASSTGAELP